MTEPTTPLLDELAWRGLLHQTTEGAAPTWPRGSGLAYCGFDPTGASLHVGHLLPIMGLVRLQHAGHRPVALVGGGTGMIGDPSGKSAERQLNTREVVEANADALRGQLERFLDFAGGPAAATMVNNLDWLAPARRAVVPARRREALLRERDARPGERAPAAGRRGSPTPSSPTWLLQSYDFVELRRRHGVTVQIGGSDQWGNITAGTTWCGGWTAGRRTGSPSPCSRPRRDRSSASPRRARSGSTRAHLPLPVLPVLDPRRDRDVGKLLRFYTLLPRAEIEALDAATAEHPERREAQGALAHEVTSRAHGAEAARVAQELSGLLFAKGDPRALSGDALAALAARCRSPRRRSRARGSARSTWPSCSWPRGS
jgi:tyrosyl-tRNA synthetase